MNVSFPKIFSRLSGAVALVFSISSPAVGGEFESRIILSGDAVVLAMGKGRLQMNYSGRGVNLCVSGDCPEPPMWAIRCTGSLMTVDGKFENESGMCKGVMADGSEVYTEYEGSGMLGATAKGSYTYVGGTGSWEGVSAGGTFERFAHRPVDEGTWPAVSFVKEKSEIK